METAEIKNVEIPIFVRLKEFVKKNPDAPTDDVVALFGCSKQNVYQARHNAGVSKKLTMTKKKRLAVVRKSTIENKDTRIAELEKQIEQLKISPNEKSVESDWKNKHDGAMHHIAELTGVLDKLEKQIIGYKAVINYLEHQLSAMAEKHGTPV